MRSIPEAIRYEYEIYRYLVFFMAISLCNGPNAKYLRYRHRISRLVVESTYLMLLWYSTVSSIQGDRNNRSFSQPSISFKETRHRRYREFGIDISPFTFCSCRPFAEHLHLVCTLGEDSSEYAMYGKAEKTIFICFGGNRFSHIYRYSFHPRSKRRWQQIWAYIVFKQSWEFFERGNMGGHLWSRNAIA